MYTCCRRTKGPHAISSIDSSPIVCFVIGLLWWRSPSQHQSSASDLLLVGTWNLFSCQTSVRSQLCHLLPFYKGAIRVHCVPPSLHQEGTRQGPRYTRLQIPRTKDVARTHWRIFQTGELTRYCRVETPVLGHPTQRNGGPLYPQGKTTENKTHDYLY